MKRTTFIAAVLCLLGTGLSCTHDEPNNSDTGTSQRVVEWQDSTLSGDAVMGEKMMFRVGDSLQVIRKPSTRLSTDFGGQTYTLSGDERITIAMKRGSEAEVIKIYKVKDAATGALEYEKDADGNKTEPFYWKSTTETVKLRAWSYGTSEAYTSDPLTTPFTLNTIQTELAVGKDNYRELLYDKQRDYPYAANITLNLYHQLARITVELTNSATSDLSIATNGVTIGGGMLPTSAQFVAPTSDSNIGSWDDLSNTGTVIARVDNATEKKYSAVVFPKTYSAGTKIVGVTTTAESPWNSYAYTLPSGGEELEAGKQYSYKVNVRDLVLVSSLTVSDIAAVTYNGSAQTPEPTVTDPVSGKVLTKDTHYTLSYDNNINAGDNTAICTVTGLGIYSGSKIKNFTINKAAPTKTDPTTKSLTYNGSAQALANAGSSSHGTYTYCATQNGTYTATIPTGTNAATNYVVYWKFAGDQNHTDATGSLTGITISKAVGTITLSKTSMSVDKGYNGTFTATLSPSDNSATVTATSGNNSYYTASAGSLSSGSVSTVTINGVSSCAATNCTVSATSSNCDYSNKTVKVHVVPKVDLIDVKFNTNGSITDETLSWTKYGSPSVSYNSTYQRNEVTFNNTSASSLSQGYYSSIYSTDIKNKIADGFSQEVFFKPSIVNQRQTIFGNLEGGGHAILIYTNGKIQISNNIENFTTYLYSNATLTANTYYHVVLVWNKSAGKIYLYINGALDSTFSGSGDYVSPLELRFTIGADLYAGYTPPLEPNMKCFKGSVLIARLYDAILSANDVSALYNVATNP